MEKANVRLALGDDLGKLLNLYTHLHGHDVQPSQETASNAWGLMKNYPGMHIIVADCDGDLVASCVLSVIPNLTRGCRPYGLIENVVTHTDYRRQGFGRRVVKYALELAGKDDCYTVMLVTSRPDPAVHHFYESCGFTSEQKTGYSASPESYMTIES